MMVNSALLALVLSFVGSCGQDYNSNSGDDKLGVTACTDCTTPAGLRLYDATKILRQSCLGCHSAWNFSTDQSWINSGLVVAGDAKKSKVINRLINVGSDMPKGGSALEKADYETLVKWVEQISTTPAK